jgi:hypothetical protein
MGRWGSYPFTTVSIPELNLSQTYRAERARSLAIATVCDVSIPRQG